MPAKKGGNKKKNGGKPNGGNKPNANGAKVAATKAQKKPAATESAPAPIIASPTDAFPPIVGTPPNIKSEVTPPVESKQEAKVTPAPAAAAAAPAAKNPETPQKTTKSTSLAIRPPRQPVGNLRKCSVNHFVINIGVPVVLQYHISFTPELERSSTKTLLLKKLNIIGQQYLFDGDALLFTPMPLPHEQLEISHSGTDYSVELKFVKESSGNAIPDQVYNVLCKSVLKNLKLTQLGRQYYDPSKTIRITQHKIELWPGFFTSVNNTLRGPTICADIAHKILRTDTVLNLIQSIQKTARGDPKKEIEKQLIGMIVLTRYNNRTYRVSSVEWKKNPLSTFPTNGGESTFVQYYQKVHNLSIADRKQPLLAIVNSRTKESISIIPELCCMTGLSDQMRNDYKVMQSLDDHTKINPTDRSIRLSNFSQSINQSEFIKSNLKDWKISLDPSPMKVEGRQLPPEALKFAGAPKLAGPKAEWNNTSISGPANVNYCIFVFPANAKSEAVELMSQMQMFTKQFKINFGAPKQISIPNDRPQSFVDAILNNVHDRTNMVICLVLRKGGPYDAIKQTCCRDLGIPSQCVTTKSLRNPKRIKAICSKIAQQINCKVGGELWQVQIPVSGLMTVGIDVCHDTYSDHGKGKRSVVGFCATTNSALTRYFSTVRFQGVGQEIVSKLGECFEEALENYKKINGKYPAKIIVYRDGVGEGQFLEVLDFEVPQIKRVLATKGDIQLTCVIVQKRVHTRIFDHTKNLQRPTNVPPGTVIDSGCVSSKSYDFYLVSQHVGVGTATPTHFRVVYDEVALRAAHLQTLTYKLCHLYFNWAGTIRVPAPCQYAHKIAFLVGQSVHAAPNKKLENLLHFL